VRVWAAIALVVAACGPVPVPLAGLSAATPAASPAGTAPAADPASPLSSAAAARPLFDAHIHYSHDAWTTLTPEEAIAALDRAGVRRALVSSTPDEGTMRLYDRDPARIVPILRPYRSRAEVAGWTHDASVVPYVNATYRRGVHRGIGEFHLVAGEATLPVVRALVELAVREGIFLHVHADDRAIAELIAVAPRARVLWAHAGMSASAETVRALVERHSMLWVELALRADIAPGGRLDAEWRDLFIDHGGRFMVGSDTWVPERWSQVIEGHQWTRAWLAQLPPDVADRIARGNAEELFGR
jgi:hypothetical protein